MVGASRGLVLILRGGSPKLSPCLAGKSFTQCLSQTHHHQFHQPFMIGQLDVYVSFDSRTKWKGFVLLLIYWRKQWMVSLRKNNWRNLFFSNHAHMTLKVKTIQNLFNCAENWLLVEVRKGGKRKSCVWPFWAFCSVFPVLFLSPLTHSLLV